MLSRRGFLTGTGAALAAPAIVKAEFIMPVKQIIMPEVPVIYGLDLEVSDDGILWKQIDAIEMISSELMQGVVTLSYEAFHHRFIRANYNRFLEAGSLFKWDRMYIDGLVGAPLTPPSDND